jgi:hypothetical protein
MPGLGKVAVGATVVPVRRGVVMTTKLVRRIRAGRAGRAVRAGRGRVRTLRGLGEEGMTTAEYAVGTVAAVAFAALLLAIVRSGPVKSALTEIIVSALGTGS